MTFPRTVLWLTGAVFLGFGLLFLVDPAGSIETVGIRLDQARSAIEVRAMYGGLEVGLGLFLIVASLRERWIRAALGAQFLVLGGLAGGRLLGMAATGDPDRLMLLYFAIEVVGAIVGITAFRHARTVLVNNRLERRRVD